MVEGFTDSEGTGGAQVDCFQENTMSEAVLESEFSNYGLIVLKPSTEDQTYGHVISLIYEWLNQDNIYVIAQTSKQLTNDDVAQLYPDIFSNTDYENYEYYTDGLRKYMTQGESFALLVYGEDAHAKTQIYKQAIRERFCSDDFSISLQNLIHTPDDGELPRSFKIFFDADHHA